MQLRTPWLIPATILLTSFCLHLSLISKGPVSVDCLSLVINSQATLITHHLQHQWGSGYPLMVLLGSTFIALGKYIGITDPVQAVNLIGVFFGSIAVLAFYLLVQEISDTLTAILASFILLLNPIFLDVSTYGINHAPALCFLLLGLLSLLRFQTKGNLLDLGVSALYLGFMGATRLQDFILTLPAISFIFIFGLNEGLSKSNRHKIRYFLLFTTTIISIILLFHLPYFISNLTNYENQAKSYWTISLSPVLFSHSHLLKRSHFIDAFSIEGIFCFVAGLYFTGIYNKRLLIFTILWWVFPLLFYSNTNLTVPRFLNILLPAVILPISILLAHLLKHKRTLWKLIAMVSFLIIIAQPLLITRKTFIRRHHEDLTADFYRWVGKSTASDATIIASDDTLFITYYSRRPVLDRPVRVLGHLLPRELKEFKEKLDNILNDQKPLYIATLGFYSYDGYMEFGTFMRKNYHLIHIGQLPIDVWYDTPYFPSLYMSSTL